ncbi:hypothetical protein IWW48_005514 [Coemansia sp. RSA 1200]|nr:hypothetical protein IWW48_005514 [Coemansia sp. RSA 1200]
MRDNWDLYVNESDISLAYSVIRYWGTSSQSTLNVMLEQCITNSTVGLKDAHEYNIWCNTHLAAVKMSNIRHVFEKYVLKFIDNDYPILRIIVTPPSVEIPAELGSYQLMTLEELSAAYKVSF